MCNTFVTIGRGNETKTKNEVEIYLRKTAGRTAGSRRGGHIRVSGCSAMITCTHTYTKLHAGTGGGKEKMVHHLTIACGECERKRKQKTTEIPTAQRPCKWCNFEENNFFSGKTKCFSWFFQFFVSCRFYRKLKGINSYT